MLETAQNAAKNAGKEIMKIYEWVFDFEVKDDNSPVTIADKLANEIILKELLKTNIPILSEESKDNLNRLNSEYLWVVDPVDGTKDFINKTWEFSIMIWLVKNSEVLLWVVFVPAHDKLYYAEKNKWSYLEYDGKIKKLKIDSNNKKILISRNHTSEAEFKLIKELWLESIPCWSVWVKFWLIAEWKAWNYLNLSNKLKQWDLCAPEIILHESGGKITDKLWNKLKYNIKETNLENGCIWTNWKNHNNIIYSINKK